MARFVQVRFAPLGREPELFFELLPRDAPFEDAVELLRVDVQRGFFGCGGRRGGSGGGGGRVDDFGRGLRDGLRRVGGRRWWSHAGGRAGGTGEGVCVVEGGLGVGDVRTAHLLGHAAGLLLLLGGSGLRLLWHLHLA